MRIREKVFAAIAADPAKPIPQVAKEVGCTRTYAYRVISEAKQDTNVTVSLTCPNCGSANIAVKDSRPSKIFGDTTVRRRRGCGECDNVWTTFEMRSDVIRDLNDRIKTDAKSDVVAAIITAMNVTPEYILDLLIQSREQSR